MRRVLSGLFITLDGVVERPDRWQFDHFDDGLAAAMSQHLAHEDTVLLGRRTYEEWAPYWPTSNNEPYASHINNTPKYVFSTTLGAVGWQNSTLVSGNPAGAIQQLKEQPGQNIGVAGSPTLVRWLLLNDLLDELTLMIHPVVAGTGRRLFPEDGEVKRLQLVEAKPTNSGVLIATYHPRARV